MRPGTILWTILTIHGRLRIEQCEVRVRMVGPSLDVLRHSMCRSVANKCVPHDCETRVFNCFCDQLVDFHCRKGGTEGMIDPMPVRDYANCLLAHVFC